MSHLGFLSFPGTGHLNPFTALGRELQSRGHKVTYLQIADCEAAIRAAGLNYLQIGKEDYPLGTLRKLDDELGRLKGFKALQFSVERVRRTGEMVLRDAPDAIKRAGIEALVVDQAEFAGGTVAEHLGLPFATVSFFIPLNLDPSVPFFNFGWQHGTSVYHRLRNRLGNAVFSRTTDAARQTVRAKRREWGLPPLAGINEFYSPRAQITQTPAAFEFPGRKLPPNFHYTGPWSDPNSRKQIDFPWERLDPNRPLVFASMGTLQNQMDHVFKTIAEACARLPVQLVLSLGGGKRPEEMDALPGDPIVVGYAPQLELIRHATLVITHAGLNTTLESLANGVPMVAIPVTNDQPGVAARIEYFGVGRRIPVAKLTADKLHAAVRDVLDTPGYRARAKALQAQIVAANGLHAAADVVEKSLELGGPPTTYSDPRDGKSILNDDGGACRPGAHFSPTELLVDRLGR